MKRLVVLISGGGSNLQAILNGCSDGTLAASVVAVISNRPQVMGLQRAAKAGSLAITLDHTDFQQRADFERQLAQHIDRQEPDLVVLAGFMRIFSPAFVSRYLGTMINIHPSLLPKYPGLNTHERALAAGDTRAGASVHFVTAELDGGPLIAQTEVDILPTDQPADLNRRVLMAEHRLYPAVIAWFCEGRLSWHDNHAWLDGKKLQGPQQLIFA